MAAHGFTLTSPAFSEGGTIPQLLTCDGQNRSPQLHWSHPPEGTRSFALIVDDPDAPNGTFTHWVLFNIPADATELGEAESGIGVNGRNDFQQDGYGGPCPPPNHGEHRYYFKLYALDVDELQLNASATRQELESAMSGRVLGQTQLMGRYERRNK